MNTFLAIFTCSENSHSHLAWKQLKPEQQENRMKKGIESRRIWLSKNKNQIIFESNRLGKTKKIDAQGIHNIPSQMGFYLVVQASSHDDAEKMFLDHPHFAVFPGDAVEVIECFDE